MPLVLRADKGTELTHDEVDGNFTYLDDKVGVNVTDIITLNDKVDALHSGTTPPTGSEFYEDFRMIDTGHETGASAYVLDLGVSPAEFYTFYLSLSEYVGTVASIVFNGDSNVDSSYVGIRDLLFKGNITVRSTNDELAPIAFFTTPDRQIDPQILDNGNYGWILNNTFELNWSGDMAPNSFWTCDIKMTAINISIPEVNPIPFTSLLNPSVYPIPQFQ